VSEGAVLSRLERIHLALGEVYDRLEHPDRLTPWQIDFLNSLVNQLHRGLTLTPRQAAVLARFVTGVPHG
jgi:hypothetical protein